MGADNLVLFVCGRKGSGKSTLVRRILDDYSRVFVLDTVGEYREADGWELVTDHEAAVARIVQASREASFRLAFRDTDTGRLVKLLHVMYEVPHSMIVVEETGWYCSPASLPRELSNLVRYGRHRWLDQIYVARRPSEIHRDLTAQADIVVSFKQRETRDVQYLSERAGEDASAVRTLPRYEVLAWGEMDKCPLAVLEQLHDTDAPHDIEQDAALVEDAEIEGETELDEGGAEI